LTSVAQFLLTDLSYVVKLLIIYLELGPVTFEFKFA